MKFYHISFDSSSGSWVQTWILLVEYDCNKTWLFWTLSFDWIY